MAKNGTNLGLVDLSSDVSPSGGIYCPRAILLQVRLTFCQPLGQTDLLSDVPVLGPVDLSSCSIVCNRPS